MIDLLSKYQPHTLKLAAGIFSYLTINGVLLDQALQEETDDKKEKITELRNQLNVFYNGNILLLHYLYSCDIINAEFMLQYLEFLLGNLFGIDDEENVGVGNKMAINYAKIPSVHHAKLYFYMVLKPARKKDPAHYLKLVEVFDKYLDSKIIPEL